VFDDIFQKFAAPLTVSEGSAFEQVIQFLVDRLCL